MARLGSRGPARGPARRAAAGGAARAVAGLALAAYASGAAPFTWHAYVAVLVPGLGLAGLAVVQSRGAAVAAGPNRREAGRGRARLAILPWVVLAAAAAGLEAVGLALGGRSVTVPTLSTVVDRALVWRPARLALFAGWLAVVLVPVLRERRARGAAALEEP